MNGVVDWGESELWGRRALVHSPPCNNPLGPVLSTILDVQEHG